MMSWVKIPLPGFSDPVPDDDRISGLVENVFVAGSDNLISAVNVDAELVAHIGLHQSWATPVGVQENVDRMRDMIKKGRFRGVSLLEFDRQDHSRIDPGITLTITLPEPYPQEMTWIWQGDGSYVELTVSKPPDGRPPMPEG